jgi:hypothetical protein
MLRIPYCLGFGFLIPEHGLTFCYESEALQFCYQSTALHFANRAQPYILLPEHSLTVLLPELNLTFCYQSSTLQSATRAQLYILLPELNLTFCYQSSILHSATKARPYILLPEHSLVVPLRFCVETAAKSRPFPVAVFDCAAAFNLGTFYRRDIGYPAVVSQRLVAAAPRSSLCILYLVSCFLTPLHPHSEVSK